ncbi:hypothetical protein [Streptosporangium sp. NPDC048865]|uniref:hypothetical protein n=1 Tax=Streptosporangium sp. NPDC048865 TaxID=3155766 RepID=UPI00341D9668
MATTIADLMLGIEARLATVPGLRTSAIAPDQINPPTAIVGVPPIEAYRETMRRGTYVVEMTVTVLVSAAIDRVGQMLLAEYASPVGERSIPAAIEADRTLGGIAQECVVDSFRPLGLEEYGAIGYYGGTFGLRVAASGI